MARPASALASQPTEVSIEVQGPDPAGGPESAAVPTTVTVTFEGHRLPAEALRQATLALLLDVPSETAQVGGCTRVFLDENTENILGTLLSEIAATGALAAGSADPGGLESLTAAARLVSQLLARYRDLAGQRSQQTRTDLLRQLIVETPEPVSAASLEQAKRDAARRNRLLATPHVTYEQLRQLRGDQSVNATRTSVSRAKSARRLFTVPLQRKGVVIPGFLLDEHGEPRPELQPLLEPLMAAQMGPWQMWTWLAEPAALLSGLIPAEAAADPATVERAARAARRLAERIVPADIADAVDAELEATEGTDDQSAIGVGEES